MRTLTYDGAVFDEGNGWIYRKIMNWTLPGLFLAAVEIGVINAGLLQAQGVPSFGRSRLYKFSKIDLYKKKIVYHKVESLIMSKPRYNVYSVTQLRKVEKKRGYYILHGAVTNDTNGGSSSELKIPVAFENMNLIAEMARYK